MQSLSDHFNQACTGSSSVETIGWHCCDGSITFWNREFAGNRQYRHVNGLPSSTVCTVSKSFAHITHTLEQGLIEYNERSKVFFNSSAVIPVCLDHDDDSVTSKWCWGGSIRAYMPLAAHITALSSVQNPSELVLFLQFDISGLTFPLPLYGKSSVCIEASEYFL